MPRYPTCATCCYLRAFELTADLYTCPVVNIRLAASTIRTFGCSFHRRKPRS